ncbi:TPA: helix-turn-helix transcriptional regulator [Clostridioides difficile]|uniref:helix-turn-helix domain-containing protein n=1 Tax=Clostridioides difficile TaxID=1496 RepID=UPI00038D4E80|nr:helix-turn-helix transcriptional regulator [Clostridioides difficile]EQG38298.1 helix-turn-helix family protein [Clostridioides difficile DA00129]HBF0262897.1 helix-turn-helix transcriptional regulator [Clostridioides difficile]HBF0795420.1 helix-turn-helix transcriptional regulator [Clostridioides difficile]HBF4022132.1 helix-turn-helix transcriptional regulator [Clostridioides difficile]HBF4499162.1 helix-turn-helix transcriptional regulator [Clostridioides difficile]
MSEKDGIIRLNLIELRKILKLTQEQMSASLKISRSNYGNIETGKVGLTERVKSDICDIYNVNKKWLEIGSGEVFVEMSEKDKIKQVESKLKEVDSKLLNTILLLTNISIPKDKLNEKEINRNEKYIELINIFTQLTPDFQNYALHQIKELQKLQISFIKDVKNEK